MTPARVAALIAAKGEGCTLKRTGQPDLSVRAFVRGYKPEELVGGLIQGDREARISDAEIAAAAWPGPPRKGDLLVIGGKTAAVQGCDTRKVGGVAYMHVMTVRG
ncbi:hypothetical protein ACM64Y_00620 [Novispirillum sp. DQ9]|uniref:hypothetical protein n=1 Tax=Novispirillum sp. DQ9 TaxID=3398612 RepID=UPI003C7DC7FE